MAATIEDSIRIWLDEQPVWVHRAASSLCDGQALDTSLVGKVAGEAILLARSMNLARPPSTNLRAYEAAEPSEPFAIEAIADIRGVNHIAENAKLSFPIRDGLSGLTVVYGGNGTGKTGYARMLKATTGQLPFREVLPNVFASGSPSTSWAIHWQNASGSHRCDVTPADAPSKPLQGIQVFDEQLANAYRVEDRELSLAPPILRLFGDLVTLLDDVGTELRRRIDAQPSRVPQPPPELAAAIGKTKFHRIQAIATAEEVTSEFAFDEASKSRLADLSAKLKLFGSESSTAALLRKAQAIRSLCDKLASFVMLGNPESQERFADLRKAVKAAEGAVSAANTLIASAAQLGGVGSNPWLSLWEAARKFSLDAAYPERAFPVTDLDSRCVLCHQILGDEAQRRLKVFEEFVTGAAATQLRKTQSDLAEAIRLLPSAEALDSLTETLNAVDVVAFPEARCLEVKMELEVLVEKLRSGDTDPKLQNKQAKAMLTALQDTETGLRKEHTQATDPAKQAERDRIKDEAHHLEARKWLSEQVTALTQEWQRLRTVAILRAAVASCNTAEATNMKTKLYEKMVTDEVKLRFGKELKALRAGRLPVAITKTKSSKAKVLHRPVLTGCQRAAEISQVLSEGELRVLSLAAFLADTSTAESRTPFIFDDPVSSLDHNYERSLARRLATLSEQRQVIVLTHRLAFVYSLEKAADELDIPITKFGLHSTEAESGIPGDFPMDRDPKAIANEVANECPRLRKQTATMSPEDTRTALLPYFARMRRATERAVEKILLNGVVQRFDQAVHTDNDLEQLTKICRQDCDLIDHLMGTYSWEIHDQSEEVDDSPVEIDDLEKDATDLANWIIEYRKRPVPATGKS
jgi:ABC-type lipoprotein export system ATPase subunit